MMPARRRGARAILIGAMLCAPLAARPAGTAAPERAASPPNPWAEPARDILAARCGKCHRGDLATAVPRALAVFNLVEDPWYARLRADQYDEILRRISFSKDLPPDDAQVMEHFVACARGKRCEAGGPQPPAVTLPPELARVLDDYERAWRSKDAAALAALFAEDGFVLSSGAPPVRGRAEIEKHYAGAGGPLVLRPLAFATEGSLGYIVGGFARASGAPDVGKFTLTLRKGAGDRWLIVSDMDNGNGKP